MPTDRSLPHSVWWWIDESPNGSWVPYMAEYDTADEAEAMAKNYVENRNDPYERLRWIKVFRKGNEAYEIFRWENPEPVIPHEDVFKFVEELTPPKKRWYKRLFRRNR